MRTILFALAFAWMPAMGPARAAMVTLHPVPGSNVFVDVPFDVDVKISGNTDALVAFGFDLDLPAGLTLNSVSLDPAFVDFSGIVAADVAGIAHPVPVTAPEFSLGRLRLTALMTGPLVIAIRTNAAVNFDHGLFFVNLPTAEISARTTVNATVIPEPSTLAIALAALGLAVAVRR